MRKLLNLSAVLIFVVSTASNCDKNEAICEEVIKKDCMCTMQYDPVCGCNKKTYGNACEAECHGIATFTKGACAE